MGETDAKVLFDQAREAVQLVQRRIEQNQIRTHVTPGIVEASLFAEDDDLARSAALASKRHQVAFEHLPTERMRQIYHTNRYRGGILDPVSIHLDPLALTRGYARAVAAAGGLLFEQSAVVKLVSERDGIRLIAPSGQIRARQVILATSVYGKDPDGRLAPALLPVMTYIIVTEPLGDRLTDLAREPWGVFDDRFATGYWRPLADGRLLWGGRIGLQDDPPGLEAAMRADLAFIFPKLADVAIERVWSGRMGFTRHRMPLAGRLDQNIWLTTGFCGHGLGTTTAIGEMLAEAILHDDRRIELVARFGRPWAGGRMGPMTAQLVYRWLSYQDQRKLRAMRRATAT